MIKPLRNESVFSSPLSRKQSLTSVQGPIVAHVDWSGEASDLSFGIHDDPKLIMKVDIEEDGVCSCVVLIRPRILTDSFVQGSSEIERRRSGRSEIDRTSWIRSGCCRDLCVGFPTRMSGRC